MKKCKKIICITMLILTILNFISTKSYASAKIFKEQKYRYQSLESIKEDIQENLIGYGYGTQANLGIGTRTVTWKKDDVDYKAYINIERMSDGSLYEGSIQIIGEGSEENLQNVKPIIDPISNPGYYKPIDTTGSNKEFIGLGNTIIGAMRTVGVVISVVSLMVIGIRYMFASTADKAAYKETMIPYLIGAIMLFTISTVLGIIYDLVKSINF